MAACQIAPEEQGTKGGRWQNLYAVTEDYRCCPTLRYVDGRTAMLLSHCPHEARGKHGYVLLGQRLGSANRVRSMSGGSAGSLFGLRQA